MVKSLRCAIYTRKSSEEGLDQAFNSLDAQREACEAYVQSQVGEGWKTIRVAYDDGGFSGGSMARPALRRLLDDINHGQVDVVVVYKVDRLTRSLADFAKIVEAFDARGVSFVSVTQAFNTTSSMGRLTLNVLLSFAQFEREVTGERIRDKIAASKAKGMWMGGVLPLGYDLPTDATTRALVVNPIEAEVVRRIFQLYLDLGSVHRLRDQLEADGVCSKARVTTKGQSKGGLPFGRGALFHLLQNRLYRGEIVHKGVSYPGQHLAIVDQDLFDKVQALLASHRTTRAHRPTRAATSPLTGLLFDSAGRQMTPAFAYGRSCRPYRYYVMADVQQGALATLGADANLRRIPAIPIEELVLDRLRRLAGGAALLSDYEAARSYLRRVEVRTGAVHVLFDASLIAIDRHDLKSGLARAKALIAGSDIAPCDGAHSDTLEMDPMTGLVRLIAQAAVKPRGGRFWMVGPDGADAVKRVRRDPALIKTLRRAHEILAATGAPHGADVQALQSSMSITDSFERRLVELAFLAPDIQRAILEGRQPAGLTMRQIIDVGVPLGWSQQRELFGFARADGIS
jgi:DNA invertase Pin-like site-specific DNA recombinase